MPPVSFPMSSTPGLRPGEGEGRLINAYTEKSGDTFYIRRTPGLTVFANTLKTGLRGMIDINGVVYAAFADGVVRIAADGAVAALTGAIPGTDGVTFARNNKVTAGASAPDVVAVRETGGAYILTSSTVSVYPSNNTDPLLTDMDSAEIAKFNSVDFIDGFFIFTLPDGRMFASQLNSTDINPLSFATAEARPDGLVRGVVYAGTFFAMGVETIEPWKNVGSPLFPMVRMTSIIPVGLLTSRAVAGFEVGWDHMPYFVAHDKTVRALQGFDAVKASTPDVEAFIARSTVSTLEACVYTLNGNAFWVLSSDQGTWELNVTTKQWHERVSQGTNRWRGTRTLKSNGKWLVGDTLSGNLLALAENLRTEAGNPTQWTIESTPMKEYPLRIAVPAAFAHFTQADDVDVQVSWSLNGGESWANPMTRSLEQADRYPVRVNRLGLSTHHGLRLRFSSASTDDFSFMGASVPEPQTRGS